MVGDKAGIKILVGIMKFLLFQRINNLSKILTISLSLFHTMISYIERGIKMAIKNKFNQLQGLQPLTSRFGHAAGRPPLAPQAKVAPKLPVQRR